MNLTHSVLYVKTAKFSMCFMGMMGKKTFFILFLFYILRIVRAKILATIFLSLVPTNIISYETVKFVYRWPVSHCLQNILLQHWYVNDLIKLGRLRSSIQFIVLTVKNEHEHPLCPSLFKRYFFHSRCKEFHKNTATHCLNDFIQLNISWHSLVNIFIGPVLIEVI